MNYVSYYFLTFYFMLCIVVVLSITCIQKYREDRRTSIHILVILGLVLLLSITDTVKMYAQNDMKNQLLTIGLACLSYVLRPTCLFAFILLSGQKTHGKWFYVLLAPLALCTIIYILPMIPATSDVVFTFYFNDQGTLSFGGSNNILRYTAHIISAVYLAYLIYRCLIGLQTKHLSHSLNLLACALVVIIAVILETFFNENGELELVTTSIAISTIFFYLYLYTERTQYDPLTGLLNRAAYYADLPRMNKDITGIVQIDMNGLKYFNDNFGHQEGDLALFTIAAILKRQSTRGMYVYRLGGDEFIILASKEDEGRIIDSVRRMQAELAKTKYRCSFGYAFRKDKDTHVEDLIKIAEQHMYEDKASFYQHSFMERRRVITPEEKK